MFDDIDTGFFDGKLQIQAGFPGYLILMTGLLNKGEQFGQVFA